MNKEIFFFGGLDTDSDARLIADGDYRDALYARSGEAGGDNRGARESVTGNLLVPNEDLTDNDVVIGTCKYGEQNAIIYFVYNGTGQHSIWQYNVLSQTHEEIITSPLLNFQPNIRVLHSVVVNNILYWAYYYFQDYGLNAGGAFNYNPPRMLNIAKAKAGYTTLTSEIFDIIKKPLTTSPLIEVSGNGSLTNLLYGTISQFAVQYVYENGERTVFSPISKVMKPQNWNFVQGRNFLNPELDNVVVIDVPTGSEQVKIIRVAQRNGNNGDFEVFYERNKIDNNIPDNDVISIEYDGSISGVVVPLSEGLRNFDRVPQVAGCLEILPSKQLALFDMTEDYDPVVLGASFASYLPTEINYEVWTHDVMRYVHTPNASDPLLISNSQAVRFGYCAGDKIVFNFQQDNVASDKFTIVYEVTATFLATIASASTTNKYIALLNSVGAFLVAELNGLGYNVSGVPVVGALANYTINFLSTPYLETFTLRSVTPLIASKPIPSLKTGVIHEFGVEYYDRALRSGGVQESDNLKVFVPFPVDQDKTGFLDVDSPYFVRPYINLKNQPPDWAAHYSIVWRRTRIADFQWRTGIDISPTPTANLYRISLDQSYESTFGARINHTVQVGDVVRLVRTRGTEVPAPSVLTGSTGLAPYALGYVEAQVERYEEGGGVNGAEAVYVTLFNIDDILDATDGFVVEIYTPRETSLVEPYYQIGEMYNLRNPYTEERYHNGQEVFGAVISSPTVGGTTFVVEGDLRAYDLGTNQYEVVFVSITGSFSTTITSISYNYRLNQTTITSGTPSDGQVFTSYSFNSGSTDGTLLYFNFGDAYVRPRLTNRYNPSFGGITTLYWWRYWVEDPHQSDYFVSNFIDIGKLAVVNLLAGRKRLVASGIHGGSYIDNTNTNNLCSFDFNPLNKIDLDEANGTARFIIMSGYTLKVLQDRKETSIYIQRSVQVDANNNVSITPKNETFAGVNPYETSFGTIHPDTVQLIDGQLFYYDYYNSKVIRSINNGQQDIVDGEYKMNSFFVGLTNLIKQEGLDNVEMRSAIDIQNNEYQLFYVYEDEDVVKSGIVFNYVDNRWVYRVAHAPTASGNLLNFSFLFDGKDLYVQNEGTNLEFFGEAKSFMVNYFLNENPQIVKQPLTTGLRVYPVPNTLIAYAPLNNSYSLMQTQMSNFKVYENGVWTEYSKDENDPMFPTYSLERKRIEGRSLRGYVIGHTLNYSGSTKIVLFSAVCNYVPSPSVI